MRILLHAWLVTVIASLAAPAPAAPVDLQPDDHIVVIGSTFAERMAMSGYFDALAHAAHPDHRLVIRHVPGSADEITIRPREHTVPTMEDHLATFEADVIVMCFGMSESFAGPDGVDAFLTDLATFIDTLREGRFNGDSAPRLVLVSPIAHEDLGASRVTGEALTQRNAEIALYVEAMRGVATDKGVTFVDLYTPSSALYAGDAEALTSNGIHPNERGCFRFMKSIGEQLGWMNDPGGAAGGDAAARLRQLAWDKHYHFRHWYRPTNTEYVFGRRHAPYGVVNFPPEREQLTRMIEARERAMWEMDLPAPSAVFASAPSGAAIWETVPSSRDFPEDEWTPMEVEAKGRENSVGDLNILAPDEFVKSFTVPEGYVIECFASEQDFEELQSPLAMAFDEFGRLWLMCTPTYPHLLPGDKPDCRLIYIEDTDGDGRADKSTIFADELYIPTGFAVDVDAVYIGQAPDLIKLTDTDGDGKADRSEIVASGFGMPDSHHTLSAFEWEPNGGFLMSEGVFTKSNVETPEGTRRTRDAAIWRFDPRTERLEVMSHCGFSNPWGHVFDDYGQSVVADASGGDNHSFAHVITAYDFPKKPKRRGPLLNRGRPTAGCELISSRHFPEDVQGSFLVNQSIGFHGTRWDRIMADGSAWRAEKMPQDMITCSDTNFRPVAMEIGPDGALYIVDWCNPLIGHMQYSVRDPRRDHVHGRVWRVRHAERELLTPDPIADTVLGQLQQLRIPERNTRQHARRRLQTGLPTDVFPDLTSWMSMLDPSDPLHDRLMLEALWIHQAHGRINLELLERVATLPEPRARAGAIRVLRHWLQGRDVTPTDALPLLERAVEDDAMLVRLEAVGACGFIPDVSGASIAAVAGEHPTDDGLQIVLEATLAHLAKYGEPKSEIARRLRLQRTPPSELLAETLDETVAQVTVLREDVPASAREEALAFLAGDEPGAQASRLLDEASGARRPGEAVDAVASLLLGMAPEELGAAESQLRDAAQNGATPVRPLAVAALLHGEREAADLMNDEPELAMGVLEYLDDGAAPQDTIAALRQAVEDGQVEARRAVPLIARHAAHDGDLFTWLSGRVDDGNEYGFDQFGSRHGTAMAALRAMHDVPGDQWPENTDQYRIEVVGDTAYEAGRAVYMDEIVGCVRCHGPQGLGEEGFPPLDRSPWVLGNPKRAAAIVIHGLYGTIEHHDGRVFNSVMDPLGGILSDEQIVDVLNYVRQSWGNFAQPVQLEHVQAARRLKSDGAPMWTETLARTYPIKQDRVVPVNETSEGEEVATVNRSRFVIVLIIVIAAFAAVMAVVSRFLRH